MEGAMGGIIAGVEEIGQHVVFVARADELSDRKPRLLGVVCRKDIAEITGRHAEIDLVASLDSALCKQICIRRDIINDLPKVMDKYGIKDLKSIIGGAR